MDRAVLGVLLILASLIPLSFFIYTLTQLDQLQISITHPRVLVEFTIFLTLLLLGIWFRFSTKRSNTHAYKWILEFG